VAYNPSAVEQFDWSPFLADEREPAESVHKR